MGILSNITTYAGSYSVVSRNKLTEGEIASISSAEVVPSDYGSSVCLHLKTGQKQFLPVSTTSSMQIGESVDLSNVEILTLKRTGDAKAIYRIQELDASESPTAVETPVE